MSPAVMTGKAESAAVSWKQRRRTLDAGCVVLAVAIVGAGAMLGVQPRREAVAILSSKLDEAAALEAEARIAESAHVDARRILDQLEAQLERLPVRLVSTDHLNQRLAMLTELAENSGLTVRQVTPGATRAATDFRAVPITLVGTGGYAACASFLSSVRSEYADTAVSQIKLSGQPAAGNAAAFTIELVWYAASERSEPVQSTGGAR